MPLNLNSEDLAKYSSKLTALRYQLSQILSDASQDSETKLSLLKSLELGEYKPIIRELAYTKSTHGLSLLSQVFEQLGDLTYASAVFGNNTKHYIGAAIFYQNVIAIAKDLLSANQDPSGLQKMITDQYHKYDVLKKHFVDLVGRNVSYNPDTQLHFRQRFAVLEDIRSMVDKALDDFVLTQHQYEYVQSARKLSGDITDSIRNFLIFAIKEAEEVIGIEPPCVYSIVGLGSMALKQMTPYSDLEFMIITQDAHYQSDPDPKVKNYFHNLICLVHLDIIALGETRIHQNKYDVDLSHLVHRGLSFDSGGHTPLGHQEKQQPFTLVNTVEALVEYVIGTSSDVQRADPLLKHILQTSVFLTGNEELHKCYVSGVDDFLSSTAEGKDGTAMLQRHVRALGILRGEMLETDYGAVNSNVQSNISAFAPLSIHDGRLFNVKQEIYRFERLIHHVANYYGAYGDSLWSRIGDLEWLKIFSDLGTINLEYAVSFAVILRLKTYSHNKGQVEDMSLYSRDLSEEKVLSGAFHADAEDLQPAGALFRYYYTSIPFYERLKVFCDFHDAIVTQTPEVIKRFFLNDFYEDDSAHDGLVYARLARYQEARRMLESALEEADEAEVTLDGSLNLDVNNTLVIVCKALGDGAGALKYTEECERIAQNMGYTSPINKAIFLINKGVALKESSKYQEAAEYYSEAVMVLHSLGISSGTMFIKLINNLAECYSSLGDGKQALECFQKSIELCDVAGSTEAKILKAGIFYNIGIIHKNRHEWNEALIAFDECLVQFRSVYHNEPHDDIADALRNKGEVLNDTGDFAEGMRLVESSMTMFQLMYGSKSEHHRSYGDALCVLGVGCMKIGDNNEDISLKAHYYDKAALHIQEAITVYSNVYKDLPNHSVAVALCNLGLVYRSADRIEDALACCTNALKMFKAIYNDEPHQEIAHSLIECYYCYLELRDYGSALSYLSEAMIMIAVDDRYLNHPVATQGRNAMANCSLAIAQKYAINARALGQELYISAIHSINFGNYDEHIARATEVIIQGGDVEIFMRELSYAWICSKDGTSNRGFCIVLLAKISEIHLRYAELYFALLEYDVTKAHKIVQQFGLDINVPICGLTLLARAINNENTKMVKMLVEEFDADVSVVSGDKDITPLAYALGFNKEKKINIELAEYLLQQGVDPNQHIFPSQDTAMHLAHDLGNKETIILLRRYGGNLNAQTNTGKTPLHYLIENDELEYEVKEGIVRALIPEYDLNLEDNTGTSPVACALCKDIRVYEYLVGGGVLLCDVHANSSSSSDVTTSASVAQSVNNEIHATVEQQPSDVALTGCNGCCGVM